LTKQVGFVYPYVKKQTIEKLMMRKMATSRKGKTHIRQWKTRPISVCKCLIVIFKMIYQSLYLQISTKY